MSISRRLAPLAVAGSFVAGILAACGEPDTCFRFSDCAPGLTCVDGRCVRPAPPAPIEPADASADAEGGTDADAGVIAIDSGDASDSATDGASDADARGDGADASDAGSDASDAADGADGADGSDASTDAAPD